MEKVKFSIIIPVYNSSLYLEDCLESVIRQTFRNIEIICIDDASVDDSIKILEEYYKKDGRIHIISKSENEGTSKARKDGVQISKGEHIVFLDADDQLMTNACEKLLETFERNKSDVIQFEVCVQGREGVEEEKKIAMKKYFQPFCRDITMDEARKLCFYDGELAHNLCGKMFDGIICRKAFSYISDDKLIMAEDLYAYFVISILSESYAGISDELYLYNYGVGITGETRGLFETLRSYCSQTQVCQKCFDFIKNIGKQDEYGKYIIKIRTRLLDTCMNFLMNSKEMIKPEDIHNIQKLLYESWNKEDLGYATARIGMYYQNLNMQYQHVNSSIKEKGWIFPYKKIQKDTDIVIYGAGDMGKDYYNQIKDSGYCNVVAWVDKAYETIESNVNYIVMSPESIKMIRYDYVVIAIRNKKIRELVKKDLIGMGVEERVLI